MADDRDSPDLEREANELIELFKPLGNPHNREDYAKQCALIHCDFMMKHFTPLVNYYTTLKTKLQSL